MHLLYPCDPFDKKQVDENYQEEFAATQAAGLACSLFSVEDFQAGEFIARPVGSLQGDVLYRGWMLSTEEYTKLYRAVEAEGAHMLVAPYAYKRCHYLPEWYEHCKEFTPQTIFCARGEDFAARLAQTDWPAYFVKDFVKSLTTSRGSIAHNTAEVGEIVDLIERYRGRVEGGVCIRRFEDLMPGTEERYFVINGLAEGREYSVPSLVQEIAMRIDSPFFSVDTAFNSAGQLRLIELGDGQVSDRKMWPASRFAEMLRGSDKQD